jgi:hypothetical protein
VTSLGTPWPVRKLATVSAKSIDVRLRRLKFRAMNLLRDERRKSESWVRVKAVVPRWMLHVGSPNMLSPSGLLRIPADANLGGGGGGVRGDPWDCWIED